MKRLLVMFFCLIVFMAAVIVRDAGAEEQPLAVTGGSPKLALNQTVEIEVEGLARWAKQKGNDYREFVLVVDGNELEGLKPALVHNGSRLKFDLARKDVNEKIWDLILSRKTRGFAFEREAPVTVRHEDVAVDGEYSASLVIVNRGWMYFFLVLFGASILAFTRMARKSDILRVPGAQPEGVDHKGRPNRKRYSLARAQMAFWFFTIIISYVFIWLVTDDMTCLTTSVLGLMGISAATGLSSAAVESGKKGEQENLRRLSEDEKKGREVEAEELRKKVEKMPRTAAGADVSCVNDRRVELESSLAAAEKEIEQHEQKIKKISERLKTPVSNGFINDILSDDNGLSFHRFQMFAWTLVLIIVFFSQVYRMLTMPDFDTALLALMGISSGTYIGFKLPSQQG
jgi:hypothetical protein